MTTGVSGARLFDQGWDIAAAASGGGNNSIKTAAAAAGFWAPTITSHFQIPPTISVPVPPPSGKGKGEMGNNPVKRKRVEGDGGGGDVDVEFPVMGMGLDFVPGNSDGRPWSPMLPDYENLNGMEIGGEEGRRPRGLKLGLGLDSRYENAGFGLGTAI